MHKRNKSKSDPFFFDWMERINDIKVEEILYA